MDDRAGMDRRLMQEGMGQEQHWVVDNNTDKDRVQMGLHHMASTISLIK